MKNKEQYSFGISSKYAHIANSATCSFFSRYLCQWYLIHRWKKKLWRLLHVSRFTDIRVEQLLRQTHRDTDERKLQQSVIPLGKNSLLSVVDFFVTQTHVKSLQENDVSVRTWTSRMCHRKIRLCVRGRFRCICTGVCPVAGDTIGKIIILYEKINTKNVEKIVFVQSFLFPRKLALKIQNLITH